MKLTDEELGTIITALKAADCQTPYNGTLDDMAHAAIEKALAIFNNQQL